jgi:predicted transcriptional regulator
VGKQSQKMARDEAVLRAMTDIVSAYIAHADLDAKRLPDLLIEIHRVLSAISSAHSQIEPLRPAIAPDKSIQDEYIVCLEDGRQLKVLKRYLRANFGMTPDAYRKKWGLPWDYPMVAPAYARRRSEFAKQIGLGKGVRKRAPA